MYNIRNKEDLIAALKRNDLQAKQLSQQYLVRRTLLFRLFRREFWSCNPKSLEVSPMGKLLPFVPGAPTRAGRADGSQGKGAPEAEGRARGHRQ